MGIKHVYLDGHQATLLNSQNCSTLVSIMTVRSFSISEFFTVQSHSDHKNYWIYEFFSNSFPFYWINWRFYFNCALHRCATCEFVILHTNLIQFNIHYTLYSSTIQHSTAIVFEASFDTYTQQVSVLFNCFFSLIVPNVYCECL